MNERSPELGLVLALAAGCGVTVHLRPPNEVEMHSPTRTLSASPADVDSWATQAEVWWVPDPDQDTHVPEWMRLLHEVAHAATGARGRVGDEGYANAWELGACVHLWGVGSKQVRTCITWGLQGDWSLHECRWIWRWWRSGVVPAPGSPPEKCAAIDPDILTKNSTFTPPEGP